MKLRNGADEEPGNVGTVMMSLRDLKEEYGRIGLIAALRVAKGAKPNLATRQMLDGYALTTKGKMGQTVKNVIESAVTKSGNLVNPA